MGPPTLEVPTATKQCCRGPQPLVDDVPARARGLASYRPGQKHARLMVAVIMRAASDAAP
jgi:hypothetical protein